MIKYKILDDIFNSICKEYSIGIKKYLTNLQIYADKHKDDIDKLRTREMLEVGPARLREIYVTEKLKIKMNLKNSNQPAERDYQPFHNKILQFAEKLEDLPAKPTFHPEYPQKYFLIF